MVASAVAGIAEEAVEAVVTAVEVVAAAAAVAAVHIVVEVAEVHTPVEAPALTLDTNLFLKFKGPPANSGRAFFFSAGTSI